MTRNEKDKMLADLFLFCSFIFLIVTILRFLKNDITGIIDAIASLGYMAISDCYRKDVEK